jgi:osmotically-inducible protein OsmY
MADKWMDDRSRDWRDQERRERDWRNPYGRNPEWRDRDGRRAETYGRSGEDRSWMAEADPDADAYEDIGRQRPGYGAGERGYGARSGVISGGGAYGGESYGRSRSQPYATAARPQPYSEATPRFTSQDYTGRRYAEQSYGARPDYGRRDVQGERREAWENDDHRGEFDRRGSGREGGGDFLQRAGERISSWFRGDDLMRGSREPEPERGEFGAEAELARRGHRGVGPKGYQRSDERISDEVHDRLTEDSWLDATDIQVEVKGGEVTLSGHVENREAKHRAERLIEDLSGVRHVQNNLRVKPGAGLTGAGQGFGSSALEAEMRRDAQGTEPGAGAGSTDARMKRN